ncbi:MAG TPA: GTP-binding protein [Trebonia sp.]|nr:GTP-binding protein [Trebonia sp.]
MSRTLPAVVPARAAERDLASRLDALAELVSISKAREGLDGVSASLITDSEVLLRRAGERLRLSGNHTVVALAGGTGSGKSTIFNVLSGATFSPPGVTRPTTRDVHACVWGMQGAVPLLDWLGVERRHRYARASALDSGEIGMNGLLLLDLPDHDSVLAASVAAVDRLTKLADMLVFVLDPQKYADASVHRRYFIPLAGHASVITVVLNQIDLLSPEQVADCEQDLRRLLDDEGLHQVQVLPISARTGAGLDALRAALARAVHAQHAASERISADIDSLIGGFAIHSADQIAPGPALRSLLPQGALRAHGALPARGALPAHGTLPARLGVQGAAQAVAGEAGADAAQAEAAELAGAGAAGAPLAEQAPPGEPGRAPWDAADWDDGQPLSAPVAPSKPPWEDAQPDGTAAQGEAADPVTFVPEVPAGALVEALAQASGVAAVAEAMASAREAQAIRFTGWPLARALATRRDPVRSLRGAMESGAAHVGSRHPGAGAPSGVVQPAAAQESEVDNAITRFADAIGGQAPAVWARALREAARSQAPQIPGALASAIREGIPDRASVPGWWRLIALWQWLLIMLAVIGVVWSAVIAIGHEARGGSTLVSDISLIPWLLIMAAAVLLLGWLTASGCHNMALAAAEREQSRSAGDMRDRVARVAQAMVLAPTGSEIVEYERFRIALTDVQAP